MERFSLLTFLLFTLLFSAIASATNTASPDDPLIRPVVPDGNLDDHILDAENQFYMFKAKFGKNYATEEENNYRFKVFKDNLRRAKMHQLMDPSAVHGVTKFSDLTSLEFERQYLGLKRPVLPPHAHKAPILTDDLPTEYDWRKYRAVTKVKNQKKCGSCWAFSAIGALEGAHFLANGELVTLSEQQLVDCDHECSYSVCDSGCKGGIVTASMKYLSYSNGGGAVREDDYPYTASAGKCKINGLKIAASVARIDVISNVESQITANLVGFGPVSAGLNAEFMQTYEGGVSCPSNCTEQLNHAVLIVGYKSNGNLPFWIIKNSWGEDFGEDGYYRLCRGGNKCGINNLVVSVDAVSYSDDSQQRIII